MLFLVSYQDVYPSPAILRSFDVVRQRASELLNLKYFAAESARMPHAVFSEHHLLVNLREQPMRMENWRDSLHRNFIYQPGEIVLTPAGMRSGWHWRERSKVRSRARELRAGDGFGEHPRPSVAQTTCPPSSSLSCYSTQRFGWF